MTEVAALLTEDLDLFVKKIEPKPTLWEHVHTFPPMDMASARGAAQVYCTVRGWSIRQATFNLPRTQE